MRSQFSVSAHWAEDFDEAGLQRWVEELTRQLDGQPVSLGIIFISPRFFSEAPAILRIVRSSARLPVLVGCSSQGLIAGAEEIEENAGISLGLYSLPGADLRAFHFTQEQVENTAGPDYWRLQMGLNPGQTNGWLVFIDPFNLDAEAWIKGWNETFSPVPTYGGLASAGQEQTTQVYLNEEVYQQGGVALSVGGDIALSGIISQGCTPIGETWIITRVEQNRVLQIGNRPAFEVLAETFAQLSEAEQRKAQGNLFIGLVMNEYLEEFDRGDFLIRNLLRADSKSGSLAVGAFPRLGQTVQFQRRSAATAHEDLLLLLHQLYSKLGKTTIYGGCLCSCNGRGSGLFEEPNHDASMIQQRLGPMGLTGFFCNGEIGPVGEKNFLHGYTASLALFVKKSNESGS